MGMIQAAMDAPEKFRQLLPGTSRSTVGGPRNPGQLDHMDDIGSHDAYMGLVYLATFTININQM